ncbi:MAG: hypothetical protein M3N98_14540 [Actinomycetota bacterium]|nr:hypothetical protein [Actinomycetota bacterium]
MTAVVTIDPTVRVRGDGTCVSFDRVIGPMDIGTDAMVIDPVSGHVGDGQITDVDQEAQLVYLTVDWDSLREPIEDNSPLPEGGDSDFESGSERFGGRALGPGGFRFGTIGAAPKSGVNKQAPSAAPRPVAPAPAAPAPVAEPAPPAAPSA